MNYLKIKILLIFLVVSTAIYSQKLSYKEYIKKNLNIFEENDTNIFNANNNEYRMFVMGEYHFRKENSDIFLKIFKNLYKNANVRVIFTESSMSHGLIFNHYLKTGDESCLYQISNISQFSDDLYIKLKEFYDSLPENDKFDILGIDIDNHDVSTNFIFAVRLLFKNKKIPKRLEILLDNFPYYSIIDNQETRENFNEIYKDFKNNTKLYNTILAEDFNTYKYLLNRVKNSLVLKYYDYNYGKDSLQHTLRENYIYNNVINGIKRHPNCNYFGQFGLAHIGLTHFLLIPEEDKVESFTAKLNNREDSPLKGKICSTAILYYDTKLMYYNIDNNKALQYLSQLTYAKSRKLNFPSSAYRIIKKQIKKDNIYILKLNNPNTPFTKISEKKFQYVIIDY